ncbi:MAG: hypothetical protein ACE5IP_10765 [Terriglobia bacterium]
MRAWVYKVNTRLSRTTSRGGATRGRKRPYAWHFNQYFRYRGQPPYDMGGRAWIRSPMSWRHLRRVRRGDLFVCYQTDERKIYGLARAAGPGYESMPGSGIFDSVDFAPRGLRLENPVDVRHAAARQVFRHVRAFSVPSRGTVHALAADEFRALLRQLVAFNPKQEGQILQFAQR